jgi:F-type H+-transporting ATPase subunit b
MMLSSEIVIHRPEIPLWQEIVVGSAALAVLCLVLIRYVLPRITRFLGGRAETVGATVARAEAARAAAAELREQHQALLGEARAEAALTRDRARADGESAREDLLADARRESERLVAAGAEQLAAEREAAARELRSDVDLLAAELAGRITGAPDPRTASGR